MGPRYDAGICCVMTTWSAARIDLVRLYPLTVILLTVIVHALVLLRMPWNVG
ncbi:hypothetical protein Cci01nite_83850 [Catellatospora citrea]|uniref:Uncharacterized protein n=1 Tax=Catellatospora citrea TaxID=53366 RepID=A0A8J3KNV0_9ACTN|nr:hypothetical protein Cci01nite_83850 [Catellatospora citrea]